MFGGGARGVYHPAEPLSFTQPLGLAFMEGKLINRGGKGIEGSILWAAFTFRDRKKDVLDVKNMCQVVNHVGGKYEDFEKISKIFQIIGQK